MFRYLAWLRRRPRLACVVVLLLLVFAGGFGFYLYATWQWRAAQADVRAGRSGQALRRLRIWLLLCPRSVPVRILAARAARNRGDFETAEAHLNDCPRQRKEDAEAVELEFLLMRVQQGDVDEVRPALWQCVEDNNPQSALILQTLTSAYLHNLRLGHALVCLDRWIDVAPDDPEPRYWRGWVRERASNYEGALQDYEASLQRDPERVGARLRLAEMLLERSNVPRALPHLERLMRQHPDRADVKARLGQCRFAQGEREEARRLLEEAVKDLPNDPVLLICLARLDLDEHQPVRAEQWLRRLLDNNPTDVEGRFTLVKALQAQGRRSEADAEQARHKLESARARRFKQLLEKGLNGNADERCEVGQAFLRTRQERLGVYWLQQALQLDPGHQEANKALAEHYRKKGDEDSARQYRRRLAPDRRRR